MVPVAPTRVAIIDDNRLVRESLTAMLNKLPDLRVSASAGADVDFLGAAKPHVLVLDVGLNDANSLVIVKATREERYLDGIRMISISI